MTTESPIVVASTLNRVLLVVIAILVSWDLVETIKHRRSTGKAQTEYAYLKVAVDVQTAQLLAFIEQQNQSNKELSDWVRQRGQAWDLLQKQNPKIKVPKTPPLPPSLSNGQTIQDKELNRATPAPEIITKTKKIYIKPKKERPWWMGPKPKATPKR